MADEILSALKGMQQSPSETYWGIGQQALGQSLPQLIDPVYGDRGTNIGIALGGALVQGLLGYQARQEAADRNLQASQFANALIQLETPEARTSFISKAPTEFQSGLSTLATALTAQKIQREAKVAEAIGLETGKLKAVQEFYNTPAGIAQREFELNKIKEEAAARRTPLEDYLAREAARKERELAVEGKRQEGRVNLQNIKDATASGREEDKRAWTEKQKEIDRDLKRALVGLGVDAAVEKKRRIDELTMQNRNAGQDPDLALVNAKAEIAKELVDAREAASGRLIEKARQEREQEAAYKRTLEMANPKAPAALVTENVKRIGASNMAVEIADDLERYNNWITYRVGTAFSAADEEALRQRLKKLSFEERKALSGTATTDKERKDINEMINGDFTAGPETKAMLLRRFASDSRQLAVDNMKGGFTSAENFIKAVEQSIQSGGRVEFGAPLMTAPSSQAGAQGAAADIFVAELKAKYGSDWKTKMNADERAAAMALVKATRQ